MKCVLLYTPADDVMDRAPLHYADHVTWADGFHADGRLLMMGTFADVEAHGAMAVFRDRSAAEAFVAGDPFVANGVVVGHELRDWNEGYVPEGGAGG